MFIGRKKELSQLDRLYNFLKPDLQKVVLIKQKNLGM